MHISIFYLLSKDIIVPKVSETKAKVDQDTYLWLKSKNNLTGFPTLGYQKGAIEMSAEFFKRQTKKQVYKCSQRLLG